MGYDDNIPYHGLRIIDIVAASDSSAHTKTVICIANHSHVGNTAPKASAKDGMGKITRGASVRPVATGQLCALHVEGF